MKEKIKGLMWCLSLIVAGFIFFRFVFPPSAEEGRSEMPDQMKELAENEAVEWMAGMWVELENGVRAQQDIAAGIDSYLNMNDVIQANIVIKNGLDVKQPYFLMVLADGIPLDFEVEDKSYLSYPLELSKEKQLHIDFEPQFSLNTGRIDFLLFFNGNPQSDYHMLSYTIWMEQPQKAEKPAVLQDTIPQRDGLKESFKDDTYGAWLWNMESQPPSFYNIGDKEVSVQKEGNMLQIPIQLPESDEKVLSFFTVATPLGEEFISRPNMASVKIQIIQNKDGKE